MYDNPHKSYFVRELTRELGEQINSIRRELLNLKKIGILQLKSKNRKKYFSLNKNCIIYVDLRNIFNKTSEKRVSAGNIIAKAGKIDLLVLSGVFVGDMEGRIDILVVGDVDKEKLKDIIITQFDYERDLRYAVLGKDDFLERISFKDKFIMNLLESQDAIIEINRINKDLVKI